MKLKKNVIILALVALLTGLAVYQNADSKHREAVVPTEEAPKADFLAPGFTLTSLDGKEFQVGGSREKPLMINFWASWCGPCAEEAPDLVRVYQKYEGQFDLYAVNVTPGDKMANIEKFVEEYKFPFPVLLDKKGEVSELYRFIVIPTSFLIDKNGVIREVINVLPPKELDKKIKNLINS